MNDVSEVQDRGLFSVVSGEFPAARSSQHGKRISMYRRKLAEQLSNFQIVVTYPYQRNVIFMCVGTVILVHEYSANRTPDNGVAGAVQHYNPSYDSDVPRARTAK